MKIDDIIPQKKGKKESIVISLRSAYQLEPGNESLCYVAEKIQINTPEITSNTYLSYTLLDQLRAMLQQNKNYSKKTVQNNDYNYHHQLGSSGDFCGQKNLQYYQNSALYGQNVVWYANKPFVLISHYDQENRAYSSLMVPMKKQLDPSCYANIPHIQLNKPKSQEPTSLLTMNMPLVVNDQSESAYHANIT